MVDGTHLSMLDSDEVAAAINGEPLEGAEMFKANLNVVSSDVGLHGRSEKFAGLS